LIYVHILDAAGIKVAQRDAPPWQGRYPTSTWQPGTLVVDDNSLPLLALPPGEYTIVVGMFDPMSGLRPPYRSRLPAVDGGIRVGNITIR
jgi:hypothetical protein